MVISLFVVGLVCLIVAAAFGLLSAKPLIVEDTLQRKQSKAFEQIAGLFCNDVRFMSDSNICGAAGHRANIRDLAENPDKYKDWVCAKKFSVPVSCGSEQALKTLQQQDDGCPFFIHNNGRLEPRCEYDIADAFVLEADGKEAISYLDKNAEKTAFVTTALSLAKKDRPCLIIRFYAKKAK